MKKTHKTEEEEYWESRTDEQRKEFEELYQMYYKYVYKYEVKHPDDFEPDNPVWQRRTFREELEETGFCIKRIDGY